jgi:organic hydroperoxide reductase OsmC/OhrA
MKLPLQFDCKTSASGDFSHAWSSQAPIESVNVSIPQEFGGHGGGFSPEDLFQMALCNCFLATFKVYAQNSKLTFEKIEIKSQLIVDKEGKTPQPVMKSFTAQVKIYGASNVDRARLLAEKAISSGFILNSVKTERNFEVSVE